MQDKVLIPEIPLAARVGCTEAERQEPQTILVDLELRCDLAPAAGADSIAAAIDYVAVRREAELVVSLRPYALIETIAESVAARVLERFAVESVLVRIRKPAALARFGVPWAGVEIVRTSRG